MNSISAVEAYIIKHLEVFNEPPYAIGVTLNELELLSAECKQYAHYTDARWSSDGPVIIDLKICGIPIVFSCAKPRVY